jgi:hypothetical protein
MEKDHGDLLVRHLILGPVLVNSALGEDALLLRLELLISEGSTGSKLAKLLQTLELRVDSCRRGRGCPAGAGRCLRPKLSG